MTEKRFTVHIVWFNYDKTEGEITLKDNGQPLLMADCVEDVQMVKGLLNELYEENQVLRETLKNQYINEICETCKFGQYEVNWMGEGEFECLKGHDAVECDGKTECDDFELNIKGMNIHMVEE